MATLFQIRRGSGSVSLVDGEIYLHKGSGSLQVSMGSYPLTLAKVDSINSGSFSIIGDITASNAYFSGDVAISGNLFLGNTSGDNISVPGVFTTNLVPGGNGTLDLGTSGAKWRTLWVNTISSSFTGSVDGISVTELSTSVDSRLDNLQAFTASITGGIDKIAYFNGASSLTSYNNSYLNTQTFGLGTSATSSGAPERLMVANSGVDSYNIATFQGAQNNSYAQVNIKNFGSGSASSTDLVLWNDVATESSSYFDIGINSSNYAGGEVGFGGDAYIYNAHNDVYIGATTSGSHGHLHLFGGGRWRQSAITVYADGKIGVNTDKFDNNATTIPTTGFEVEISGSVKFGNNVNIVGSISSSVITSMQVATASLNTYTSSLDTKLTSLATISGSLISTASLNTIAITNLNTKTSSLESRATNLATITGSLITTASNQEQRLGSLQSYTASLNQAIQLTGSTVSFLGDIVVYGTQSIINSTNLAVSDNIIYLNATSSTTNIDFGIIGHYNDGTYRHGGVFRSATDGAWRVFKGYQSEISGAVNLSEATFELADFKANDISSSTIVGIGNVTSYSSSVNSRLTNLQSKSASVDNSVSLFGQYTQSQDTRNTTLQTYTASVNSDLTIIHQTTASLNTFSASVTSSLVSIYSTTASLNLFSASVLTSLTSIYSTTASLNVASASLQTFSSSALLRLTALETETGSLESRASNLATISGSLIQTASLNTIAISNLNLETASLETRAIAIGTITGSLISSASSFETRFGAIAIETGSLETRNTTLAQVTSSLKIFSASINTYTSSTDDRLDLLEYTASISVGAGLAASFDVINAYTASTNIRLNALETYSASYAQYFTYSGSQYHIDFNV